MKVNVYLNPNERKQLEQIKIKYQVSLSTIAEKTAFYLAKYYSMANPKDIEHIYEVRHGDAKHKTSIKPKDNLILKAQINKYGHSPNIIYTNALKFYLDHKLLTQTIKEEKLRTAYYMEIDRELQKTNEPNWNYNNLKRNFIRLQNEQNNRT